MPRSLNYIAFVESLYAEAEAHEGWLARVMDAAERSLPAVSACGLSLLREIGKDRRDIELAENRGPGREILDLTVGMVESLEEQSYRGYWYPRQRVLFASNLVERSPQPMRALYDMYAARTGERDFVGLVGHPVPGWAFVFFSGWPADRARHSNDRATLERLRIHIESALRLRLLGGSEPLAVVSPLGKIEHVTPEFEADAGELGARSQLIERIRGKAGRADHEANLGLWKALVDGRYSLVEHIDRDGKRSYRAFGNPPSIQPDRRLTPRESAVLEQTLEGVSGKLVAYGLGITSAEVSRCLASAALKLGFRDRTLLLRTASGLLADRRPLPFREPLSEAELDVLRLVRRGLSNAEIARLRARSDRTVANQVAALLRKTGVANRRSLMVARFELDVDGDGEHAPLAGPERARAKKHAL